VRGLPRVPDDVLELVYTWTADGSTASTSHWLFCPGAQALGPAAFHDVWIACVFAATDNWLAVMAGAGQLRTCRLARAGLQPLVDENGVASNHGALGGCQALNVATPIHWRAFNSGRRGVAVTRLPAFPDSFTTDHVHIDEISRAQIESVARDFRHQIEAIVTPAGANLGLVTLHRSAGGAPLPISETASIYGESVAPRVATLRRRLNGVRPG